jgi:hypothetical protein
MRSLVFDCFGGFAVPFSLAKPGIAMNTKKELGQPRRTQRDAEKKSDVSAGTELLCNTAQKFYYFNTNFSPRGSASSAVSFLYHERLEP